MCCSFPARSFHAEGGKHLALTSFELGKLKVIGHVREELDRVGIAAESIRCIAGGIETPPGMARLTITVGGASTALDFKAQEIEDCEVIVAGETWHKIAAVINRLVE
jgi:hypothetical protein